MNVLVVEPGYAPYEKEVNGLKEMQAVVGGSIQAIYPYQEPVAIVCNEEELLLGLPFNRSVGGGYGGVFGAFFVCGLRDGDFCSLTPKQVKTYRKEFRHAELLLGMRGDQPVTLKIPPRPKEPPEAKGRERPEERE